MRIIKKPKRRDAIDVAITQFMEAPEGYWVVVPEDSREYMVKALRKSRLPNKANHIVSYGEFIKGRLAGERVEGLVVADGVLLIREMARHALGVNRINTQTVPIVAMSISAEAAKGEE